MIEEEKNIKKYIKLIEKSSQDTGIFQDLMLHRIHEILLVASPYDAFILEEDGQLTEQILHEYIGMNLSYAPRVWQASTAAKAMNMLSKRKYDLVIVGLRISDMDPLTLGKMIKESDPQKPVVLLVFDESELQQLPQTIPKEIIDKVFVWSGNAGVFPAIIKFLEDRKNVNRDIKRGNIRLVMLVEDNPRYYSMLLPLIYKEILFHTRQMLSKSLNDTHRLLHMRGRAKVLLASTYEEAERYFKRYGSNILGIISDIRFPKDNKLNPKAGLEFTQWIRKIDKAIPIILQSTDTGLEAEAKKNMVEFFDKQSPTLLKDITNYITRNFGFGDFIFRKINGTEISQAKNLRQLKEHLSEIPNESLLFHASKNHFSNWLAARGEFKIASILRDLIIKNFESPNQLREMLIEIINKIRDRRHRDMVVEFTPDRFDPTANFTKISGGSLGGKARGLAFARSLLEKADIKNNFPSIKLRVPKLIVIGTEEFDLFMKNNELWEKALNAKSNKNIVQLFLKSRLTKKLVKSLKIFLSEVHYPLAVRSSSLLEDSQYQPLAGLYETYMLPNSSSIEKERLSQLCEAVKRVYASQFFQEPKSIMDISSHRHDEEKMAIIIQELIGQHYGNRFYPTLSGVAQSYNYYPVSYMKREEGVGFLALGFGKIIVEGEKVLRFSPEYPAILPQFFSIKSTINNSQRTFFALDMKDNKNVLSSGETENLKRYNLNIAEKDNSIKFLASVVCSEDGLIRDSLNYQGVRVLLFSSILKYNKIPLTEILKELLELGRLSLGCPIEIEYAINIYNDGRKPEFCLLQIKPMVIKQIERRQEIKLDKFEDVFCSSSVSLGDGIIENLYNIIYIKPDSFNLINTTLIANQLEELNKNLKGKPYILIGPGRWGTADPWLGIPVHWNQISNAKVIVEFCMEGLDIDPSFGSHFFQNVTSLRVGYFTVSGKKNDDFLDWDWIEKQEIVKETEYLKLIEFEKPLTVFMDGTTGAGRIFKPIKPIIEKMDEEESSGI
ncbi:MAG: hypothetical protein CMF96_11920 [Candidatus Marinimicrobia bacterium]|nr:hypothetical protein [Candidatus Neomarinimicrobiota bacterium]